MVIVEKSFPRGGIVESKEAVATKPEQIFGAVQRKIKKNKTKTTAALVEEDEDLKPRSAELLTYDTIQDGMIVMGIVKSVDQLYLNVTLPGRISARVSVLEVSDAYTKSMKEFLQNSQSEGYKPLQDLYSVGKIVYGRIKEIKQGDKGEIQVDMTLKPSEVHAELVHANIKKGFVFNGAVEEIQEHGYIIESGIKGLRCFVPIEKSEAGHAVGELIYLKVDKVTADKSVSTCICAEIKPNKLKIKDQNDPNLDYILPTTIVNFQVSKVLKNGLQGSIMNEVYTAYVNEHQLADPLTLPEDYEVNVKYEARILYVMPLTKFVYLTLNLRNNVDTKTETSEEGDDEESTKTKLNPGDIVENAKVHHLGTGGVVLILNNKFKGIISYKTIKANYKGNYDQDELLAKYARKSKHTVRITNYDIMDSMYICTDDAAAVNEKYFSFNDIKPGDFVTATVKEINHKVGGYSLQLGRINAFIEKLFLAPSAKTLDPKTKVKCRVVHVNPERKLVYLTNRSEYMNKSSKPLLSLDEAKVNSNYLGTVVKCTNTFALVKFFGDVKGVFYKQNALPGQLENLEEGQTIQFRIASKKDDQLILGLVENAFKLGEICPVTVVHTLESGLEIKVNYFNNEGEDMEQKGLIPVRLLSDYIDLLRAKLHLYPVGEELKAVCISGSIFSLRDVKYFSEHLTCDWKSLKIGNILKSYVKDVNEDVVEIVVPIEGYTKTVKVHLKMMLVNAFKDDNIELSPDQVVYVKVLGKEDSTKTITVSAKLTDVWDGKMSSTANFCESYLTEISDIKQQLKKQGHAIARYSPGDKVTAQFRDVNEVTNDWEYVLNETEVVGIVKTSVVGKAKPPKKGTKQECVILWVDYSNQLVFLSNKPGDLEHISTEKNIPANLVGKSGINAKVLFKNESVFVCSLKKGKNPVVFCPTQLHYNDFEYTASKTIAEGQFCKLAFIHESQPIAILDDTHKLWQEINRKRKLAKEEKTTEAVESKKQKLEKTKTEEKQEPAVLTKKQKLENEAKSKKEKQIEQAKKHQLDMLEKRKEKKRTASETKAQETVKTTKTKAKKTKTEDSNNASDSDNDNETKDDTLLFYEDKAPDTKAAEKVIDVSKTTTNSNTNKKPQKPVVKSLTGVNDFWNLDLNNISTNVESSDDDDDNDEKDEKPSNKKKLTAAEKFKQQREEEARLRAIEEKYADPNQLPDSVDQFDRLVLSDPNNSKHWINYMVFHLQSTEIDKARAVARRALKTITFRNSDDQINIWVALLNLELRYGSKETFNDTLKEALMYNEPLKIYLRTVEIITDAQKTAELVEIIGNLTKKFKTEPEVWRVCANAFFTVGMTERAQQLLHKALACLPERDHVNTIVVFANLNHRHGNNEMAQTLLDQVVTSYPKRVDVWCQYVDMLVKAELIDSARNILERAVVKKYLLRKMRTIFKKYLEFEERFGNDTNVQRVKLLAMDYVKKNENL
ncbi:LOW QUALITY PROTEIN: protein RRP5 homolog [Lucilia sericata]|uniref:LOW QUALITY PROTEIN: protein RRP5 homolog n=1 Tax=Lucilia sericata TaxID=13632 RepID=UPI0018A8475B|nr:LOW QUALITY PROTEIN: protein RRP5 homolog [Lucilia sericata]